MKMRNPFCRIQFPHVRNAWAGAQAHGRVIALAALCGFLAGCGTKTELPPWPRQTQVVSDAGAGQASPSPAAPMDSAAVVQPVSAPEVFSAADAGYGEAVASRYPAPDTRYNTPGLQPLRQAFTSNEELGTWLSHLAAQAAGSTHASVLNLGQSSQGLPMLALLVTRASNTHSQDLQQSGRPTVLLVGQQHGDAPAGAEALMVIARELTQGLLEPLLDRINVVIVARANPDGAASGTRDNAHGVDIAFDYLALNTPEAQVIARIMREYDPAVVVDLQEYNPVRPYRDKYDAIAYYDALVQGTTTANTPEFLNKALQEWFLAPLADALDAQSITSHRYFSAPMDMGDRALYMGTEQPVTLRNIGGLANSVGVLVSARGEGLGRAHIQRRVHTLAVAATSVLQSAFNRADDLMQVRSYVEREVASSACHGSMTVLQSPALQQRSVDFVDPVTGADKALRLQWYSALLLQTVVDRERPCGYWLSESAAEAVKRLQWMGVNVLRVAEGGSITADVFHGDGAAANAARAPDSGSAGIQLTRQSQYAPVGSYYINMAQPRANVIAAALEPDTPYSFYSNHLYNALRDVARVVEPPAIILEEMY